MIEIKLIVDFDEEIGFYHFIVTEDGESIHYRPGFVTKEAAERVGDAWIREYYGDVEEIGD